MRLNIRGKGVQQGTPVTWMTLSSEFGKRSSIAPQQNRLPFDGNLSDFTFTF